MKASQLPLDFSLNVKADGVTNLNIHVKTAENGASMLISPDKSSQSAFKVVTPKHADGKFKMWILLLISFSMESVVVFYIRKIQMKNCKNLVKNYLITFSMIRRQLLKKK